MKVGNRVLAGLAAMMIAMTSAGSAAATEWNACELLSTGELEAILGASFDGPEPSEGEPILDCSWSLVDFDGAVELIVTRDQDVPFLFGGDAEAQFNAFWEEERESGAPQDVGDRLGRPAFRSEFETDYKTGSISVLVDGAFFEIYSRGLDSWGTHDVDVARAVLEKLMD